jgi:hypothetical protein
MKTFVFEVEGLDEPTPDVTLVLRCTRCEQAVTRATFNTGDKVTAVARAIVTGPQDLRRVREHVCSGGTDGTL